MIRVVLVPVLFSTLLAIWIIARFFKFLPTTQSSVVIYGWAYSYPVIRSFEMFPVHIFFQVFKAVDFAFKKGLYAVLRSAPKRKKKEKILKVQMSPCLLGFLL